MWIYITHVTGLTTQNPRSCKDIQDVKRKPKIFPTS